MAEERPKYSRGIFLTILASIAGFIWYAVFSFDLEKDLRVTFFDVGQGDAIFIESPAGAQMLVDGGPSNRVVSKLGRAMPFWDRSIDVVVLTHPDKDHITGFLSVLERYDVAMILWTGVLHSIAQYEKWKELIREEGAEIVIARAGQRVDLGGGVFFDVFAPLERVDGVSVPHINDTNIVGILRYGETSFLLTGDAEKATEYKLLLEAPSLDVDVLKVGHHGSKTSSLEQFVEAASPEIAVIQVGENNRYGHPNQDVLDRLAAAGAEIFRNDTDGDIIIRSDGKTIDVSSEKR